MRSIHATIVLVGLAPFVAACDGSIDPTGVYETSARSHAVDVTRSADGAPAADTFARDRLVDLGKGALDWQMTLQLGADHTFSLTTSFATSQPVSSQRGGTWRWDGDRLELTTTTDGGQALEEPRVQHAQVDSEKLRLQPDLVLHKIKP